MTWKRRGGSATLALSLAAIGVFLLPVAGGGPGASPAAAAPAPQPPATCLVAEVLSTPAGPLVDQVRSVDPGAVDPCLPERAAEDVLDAAEDVAGATASDPPAGSASALPS